MPMSLVKIIPWSFVLLWIIVCHSGWAMGAPNLHGGVTGERLEYSLKWLGIPAGRATVVTKNHANNHMIFEAEASTIGIAKLFGPIRDRFQAVTAIRPMGFTSLDVFKHQRKGDNLRLTHDFFDWKNKILQRIRVGEETQELPLVQTTTNDPLTGLFSVRARPDFGPGKIVQMPVLVGWEIADVTMRAGPVERRPGPGGWFDVFQVTVEIPHSDLFRNPDDLVVWLTADPRRIPLRVESVLRLGRATVDLIAFEDGRGGRGRYQEEKPP
ncbi:MAG: DUF3108 domain-containing protein [Magnetococcales bacterium]|nr:DUF3108 domain-containing protein [Magnetococcales bacterium]